MTKGKAFIFSAPSGSGKTTIVKYLLEKHPSLEFSISATTRSKRGDTEVDGKDYYFLSLTDFQDKIGQNQFVEWEEVYDDIYYGTLKSEIERIWSEGKHVIFDVDVKGGLSLKKYFGDDALALFVKVADLETLKQRLQSRGSEDEKSLNQRIEKAKYELSFEKEFDAVIVNDVLQDAYDQADTFLSDFINSSN